MKHIFKVYAYIVRHLDTVPELLVFSWEDQPGFIVPKGTVEPGEPLKKAVLREVLEESGLLCVRIIKCLGTTEWMGPGGPEMDGPIEKQTHYFYLMYPTEILPDQWTHVVQAEGYEQGASFHFQWQSIRQDMASNFMYGSDRCLGALYKEIGIV